MTVGDAEGKPTSRTRPDAQAPKLGELAGCGIQRRRHRGCVTREDPPGLGEPDRAADALDERDAEALLESLELLADRRAGCSRGPRRRR